MMGHKGGQEGGASPGDLKLSGVTLGTKEKVEGDKVKNQELGPESLQSSNLEHSEIVDAIHARPEQRDSCGQIIPSRFNTVLVKGREQTGQGNKGM